MIAPSTLDCAPLHSLVTATLSDAELRRIAPVQRALLAPLDHAGIDEWRSAVNRALMRALRGDAAMFQLDVPGVDPHFSEQMAPGALEQYSELLPDLEKTRGMAGRYKELGAGNRAMLWGEHLEWLYQCDYFHNLVVDTRAFDPLWVSAPVRGASRPAVVHVYHNQRASSRYFGATELQLMRVLRPAFEAGVRIITGVNASRASLEAILESRSDGGLVYDLDGQLLYRSRSPAGFDRTREAEEEILAAGREMAQGFPARSHNDPIHPRDAARTLSVRGTAYRLTAVLLGEGVFALAPTVLVTFTVGPAPLPVRNVIRERFGLTRRQAEVALLLAARKTNPEIAELLCISPHTVRSHVEAVMQGLGVHDRREIQRRLTGG